MTDRSITLFMVPKGAGKHSIVTDHGHEVTAIDGEPTIREAHGLAERITGAMVKLITPINTVTRTTGIVFVRPTEDTDDPILTRLIRMIRG